jgi:hypothetical protein
MQNPGHAPDLPDQVLHFSKIAGELVFTLQFEEHWFRGRGKHMVMPTLNM